MRRLLLLLLPACHFVAFSAPPPPPAPSITTLPGMPKGTAVSGRDDGLSVRIGSFNCFLFGDSMLTAPNATGENWVVNTMYHTTDNSPEDGLTPGYNYRLSGQPPIQFVPYTAAEAAYRAAHKSTDGYMPGIWPNGQFYSPLDGRHYITFDKVIEKPGAMWDDVGAGLAVLPSDPINNTATRVQSRPGNTEDYLMWDANERNWGHMCAVRSNHVYFFHIEGQYFGALRVARAPMNDGPDPDSDPDFLQKTNWSYWNGASWVADNPSAATAIGYGYGVGTIDWNAYLPNEQGSNGCYLLTYLSWVSTNICMRVSSDLLNWSAERVIAGVPNIKSGEFPYFGRAHYCLEKERGRVVYISYCRPAVLFSQDIAMIRADFPRPALRIQKTATNTVVLSWPASFGSGFRLHETRTLENPNWAAIESQVTLESGTNVAVLSTLESPRFLRLALP